MRTLPETRARSAQEAGKRARKLSRYKANQACSDNTVVLTSCDMEDFFTVAYKAEISPSAHHAPFYPLWR